MPEAVTISCDANDLAENSKCYCYDEETWRKVMVYLLAGLADKDELTPDQLAEEAKCMCIPDGHWESVMVYLLCEAVNAE